MLIYVVPVMHLRLKNRSTTRILSQVLVCVLNCNKRRRNSSFATDFLCDLGQTASVYWGLLHFFMKNELIIRLFSPLRLSVVSLVKSLILSITFVITFNVLGTGLELEDEE